MSLRVSKSGFNIREKLNELDRPIGVQGNNILRSKTASESFEIIQAGRRNMIINGDMMIAQRGTYIDANTPSRTTGITADTFGACDRWELDIGSAGTFTQEQVKDAPLGSGFMFSSKITCTTAETGGGGNTPSGLVSLRQKIEHGLEMSLQHNSNKAKPFTVSFWVKSNEPGKYYVRIISINSTASMQISRGYNIEQSGVWEFKTVTFPPDTQTGYNTDEKGEGMQISFSLGMNQNSYGSAHYGHWHTNPAFIGRGQTNLAAATNNYFRLTGVQLEIGSEHTEFEHRPFGEELLLCQRYFEIINLYGANTTYTGGGYNRHIGEVFWKVEKRAIPTSNTPGVGNYQPGGGTGTVTISGPTVNGGVLNSGNTNQTYPDGWINGGSILEIDAEL